MTDNLNGRRGFIKAAGLGAAGLAIAGRVTAASYERILGANDRVRVGIVGFSDRVRQALIPAMMTHCKELNFDIIAVSDIWSRRRDEAVTFIGEAATKRNLTVGQIAKARNNDELYDMKDVNAVIVGTADFQHALHGVEAVRAGRDAYVEKPLANQMEDARAILKAVDETKKIVQIGTQRRSTPNYMRANEYLRSGKFGDINMVEMSWNVNQPGRWRRAKLVKEIRKEDTDWNRYLMNRPKEEWDARKYLEFRLF
nr:Gfo/Idh/MocA family oxidoreductase [Pyrinomonadaceae bacterium]